MSLQWMSYQSLSFLSSVWIMYGSKDVPFIRSRVLCGYDAWQWATEGLLYFWSLAWLLQLKTNLSSKLQIQFSTTSFLQSIMNCVLCHRWNIILIFSNTLKRSNCISRSPKLIDVASHYYSWNILNIYNASWQLTNYSSMIHLLG
jgi:hypothetical protein